MIPNEAEITHEMIFTEVGIMLLNEGSNIIECYDSLIYQGKPTKKEPNPKQFLWMALEPMSGDMEKVINFTKENDWRYGDNEIEIEENFIRYVIYKTL